MTDNEAKVPVTEEELIEGLLDFIISAANFAKKAYRFAKNRQAKEIGGGHND